MRPESRPAALIFALATLLLLSALPGAASSQPGDETPVAPFPPVPSAGAPAWAAFERASANITAYSATVAIFEQKGTEEQRSVFDYTFRKPASATVHYTIGVNAGATLEWNGGDTVVAHRGSGLFALFKRTFGLHDAFVTTIRGSSIDQLSFSAIFAHSQETAGTISQGSGPTIFGIPTESVMLVPLSPLGDAGMTHEIVDVSATTGLPMRVLGYEGTTLVRQVDFSDIKLER